MSDFIKKLQQKYGDQQSSQKPPLNDENSDQETKDNNDFFIDHNAFQDESAKKKKGKSKGKHPKIKNKFFQDLADTNKENSEVDDQQAMDLIVKEKPVTVQNTEKKNKFAQKVQYNKNRRNFQMGHTDQQYKEQFKVALQDAKQVQSEEQLELVLAIPKICKGNNRHVDNAIFLKNTHKTKTFEKEEGMSNSRVSKKELTEQSRQKWDQNKQKIVYAQCFKVTSLQDVKQNQEQLLLDEDSQKIFRKMKNVSQAIKQKKQLNKWRQTRNQAEGASTRLDKPKKKKKPRKEKKDRKINDQNAKNYACYFQEEADASNAQGQFSEDEQQYDGVDLNQQLADLIDNSECFNENDGYIARKKFMQDDRLQQQKLINKIREGLLARKRRARLEETQSQKHRRNRMEQVAKRFKKEDQTFLNHSKSNHGREIDMIKPGISKKQQQNEQRDSQNEKNSQIKLLQEQLGLNQKRKTTKQSKSKNKKGVSMPPYVSFDSVKPFVKDKAKSKLKQKKQKGFLGGNTQKSKSIIAFDPQKDKKKSKPIEKKISNMIFLQIKDEDEGNGNK